MLTPIGAVLIGLQIVAAEIPIESSLSPSAPSVGVTWSSQQQDTTKRQRAIEYSNGYAVRAKIHKIGSYAMLPLFGAQYYLGDQLLDDDDAPAWMGSAHTVVAGTIGALFVVNTVTGALNLWESRRDPAGRTRRIVHSVLLTAADAGFVWTASLAEDNDGGANANHRHRDVALGSIALSTLGTVMMWVWK